MAKYIFATKFKKIEKEPLYYNIQVSVDKDFSNMNPMEPGYEIKIYKDAPIVMEYLKDSISEFGFPQWGSTIHSGISKGVGTKEEQLWFYLEGENMFCMCQDYDFYISEIIQVVYRDTTFTFTPIPVYETEPEPLYYNIQVSVDKDCNASELHAAPPTRPGDESKDFHFYKDSPIILSFISENYWRLWTEKYIDKLEINKYSLSTKLIFEGITILSICEGYYPLPEIVSVVKNGVTFTFTPIPVYE